MEHDPLLAGMVWRVLMLLIFGTVYVMLRNEDADHEAFGDAMVNLRLFPDSDSAVEGVRSLSRWLTVLGLVLVLWQSGRLVDRKYPNLIVNRTITATVESAPKLSKRKGASISGTIKPGATPPADAAKSESGGKASRRGEEPSENN